LDDVWLAAGQDERSDDPSLLLAISGDTVLVKWLKEGLTRRSLETKAWKLWWTNAQQMFLLLLRC
jgi:hypothetical protein